MTETTPQDDEQLAAADNVTFDPIEDDAEDTPTTLETTESESEHDDPEPDPAPDDPDADDDPARGRGIVSPDVEDDAQAATD